MTRKLVFIVMFIVLGCSVCAQQRRVALVDFTVHSDNPKYSYLGKGISEMIAVELAKSPAVALVEREQRVELMKEMDVVLSGLADSRERQVEVGRLLTADYLVFGEIVDMQARLMLSLRMTSTETGEVVWRERLIEKAGNYEYIIGYFSTAILEHFGGRVAEATVKKTRTKEEKDEKAVVAFSRAIEAYDQGDTAEAREELETARRINPDYDAARYYLNKINLVIPKYQPEYPFVGLTNNPALAGMVEEQMAYFRVSTWEWYIADQLSNIPLDQADSGMLARFSVRLGWMQPLAPTLGIIAEISWSLYEEGLDYGRVVSGEGYSGSEYSGDSAYYGISAGLGWSFAPGWSLGIQGTVNYPQLFSTKTMSGASIGGEKLPRTLGGAVGLGLLGRLFEERLIVDLNGNLVLMERYYLDLESDSIVKGSWPSNVTLSIAGEVIEQKLFLSLRSFADIFRDPTASGLYLKESPVIEYWPVNFFGCRGGYHFSWLAIDRQSAIGDGFIAGFTVKLGDWDVDFNYSRSDQPLMGLEGEVIPDYGSLLLGVSYRE
jgi:TolB-like protein